VGERPDRDPSFEQLLDAIRHTRGFDFTGYKRASLTRRFDRRMQAVHVQGYEAYRNYLDAHPEEFAELFNTILINVTAFFRDAQMWDYLASDIVPRIVATGHDTGSIRVWSAGCSTGEEPYSIAILLAEALGDEYTTGRVKIYATDADEDALAVGRHASYPESSLSEVPAELREKYFEQLDGRFTLRPELRRTVIFGRHDLIQDPPISRVDLLTARNTLMYFEPPAQSQVLANFHFALRDSGYLFLGKSEVLMTRTNLFVPVDLKRRVFSRIPPRTPARRARPPAPAHETAGESASLHEAAFESGAVPQIVVDGEGRVALANLQARALFGLSRRDVGRQLHELEVSYRPADLRSAIDDVRKERRTAHIRNVEITTAKGGVHFVDIAASALLLGADDPLAVSITFTDVTRYKLLQETVEVSRHEGETAYEELQATFEELETTNEELQSTNEELETTNEELQAANEELETMNEELQSTNEQLEAINEMINVRTSELNAANTFLESVLSSLDAGVVVLDAEQIVTEWNAGAEELWGVRADEVRGKHFMNIDIGLPVEQLRTAIRRTLADGTTAHVAVPATNRRGRTVECAVTLTPLDGAGGNGARGVIMFMAGADQ
jgi:two-component system, chemotaxis family, CheB/CheR fusion protein